MISIDLKGAEQFINSSRRARSLFARTVVRSLQRSLRKPASERRRMTMGHPMLDKIRKSPWGKKKGNRLTDRIKRIGPWIRGTTVEAGIGMYGYPAAARTGDRIPPHTIRRGERTIFGRLRRKHHVAIQHPGARVIPQITAGRDLGGSEVDAVLRQLERDVHQMLERVYGL